MGEKAKQTVDCRTPPSLILATSCQLFHYYSREYTHIYSSQVLAWFHLDIYFILYLIFHLKPKKIDNQRYGLKKLISAEQSLVQCETDIDNLKLWRIVSPTNTSFCFFTGLVRSCFRLCSDNSWGAFMSVSSSSVKRSIEYSDQEYGHILRKNGIKIIWMMTQ